MFFRSIQLVNNSEWFMLQLVFWPQYSFYKISRIIDAINLTEDVIYICQIHNSSFYLPYFYSLLKSKSKFHTSISNIIWNIIIF